MIAATIKVIMIKVQSKGTTGFKYKSNRPTQLNVGPGSTGRILPIIPAKQHIRPVTIIRVESIFLILGVIRLLVFLIYDLLRLEVSSLFYLLAKYQK